MMMMCGGGGGKEEEALRKVCKAKGIQQWVVLIPLMRV